MAETTEQRLDRLARANAELRGAVDRLTWICAAMLVLLVLAGAVWVLWVWKPEVTWGRDASLRYNKLSFKDGYIEFRTRRRVPRYPSPPASAHWGAMGIGHARWNQEISGAGIYRHTNVHVSVAWPLLLVVSLLAWRGGRAWMARSRTAAGCCPSCGYDLRATPERCPECGTAPK